MIDEVFAGLIRPLPVGKINYLEPCAGNVIFIATAFEVYHTLEIGLREAEIVAKALSNRRFAEVYRNFLAYFRFFRNLGTREV